MALGYWYIHNGETGVQTHEAALSEYERNVENFVFFTLGGYTLLHMNEQYMECLSICLTLRLIQMSLE